jgi:WD40 repeat protein
MINDTPTTLFQKSLHNGVIFSIDFNHNFLLTCSDDRSIKIYSADENWILTELRQLFGHVARVFSVKVIKYEGYFLFLSAGEDSNLCIWSEDGKLLKKKNIDASGGIWSVDYDEKNEIILTSSSTGKLNQFRVREILYEKVIKDFTVSFEIFCEL